MVRQDGQSALEYAILLGLVVLLAIGALSILAGDMSGILDSRRNSTTSGTDQLYALMELKSAEAQSSASAFAIGQPVVRQVMMLGIDPATGRMTMSENTGMRDKNLLPVIRPVWPSSYRRAVTGEQAGRLMVDTPPQPLGLGIMANRKATHLTATF